MSAIDTAARPIDSVYETAGSKSSRSARRRDNSDANSRMPLTSVAANRNDQSTAYRAPYSRVEELVTSPPGVSRSGSEADSLLDLYRGNNGSDPKITNRSTSYDNEVPENMYRPQDEDPEGWIHRDKLAKIESEELQAAGINLSSARRGRSKSGRRDTSRSRKSEESQQSGTRDDSKREEKKPRLSEPVKEEEPDDDRHNWDLRIPEEIAQDSAAAQMYSQPTLKKSGSRIPVLTSSPHPIPTERLDRDTPLPRKRTISNITVLSTPTPKPTGSRDGSKPSSPTKKSGLATPNNLPPTASAASLRKVTPSSLRKPSGPNKTANGPLSPTGSTRGERARGDPPWLATMYKPDPRLPPDQQIIPTHARKQQAAQWADDGSVPKTYDRDFTPLAVHQPEELAVANNASKRLSSTPSSPAMGNTENKENNPQAWPLKPMNSIRSTHSSNHGRPGTSGSITGNYSTMPKVQPSPIIQQTPMSPRLPPPARLQEQRPGRDNEKSGNRDDDDGTVKKGVDAVLSCRVHLPYKLWLGNAADVSDRASRASPVHKGPHTIQSLDDKFFFRFFRQSYVF
ncbi:uncharacterized protein AB675_8802 [Cyphellophora attinorum]|uniref:Uncharacterized protein n=1 Tax=Cyphellophora attinorum TaxID=1664694 RepID=A0A0N0NQR7_9EURO|nr:uncharacterized protein AB675_8802 [Phialophora attinorum]KPI44231.1 hypothetical protein AB675_8802 [Phialophora attinorum]